MTWLAVTAVAFELYGGSLEEGTRLRANFAPWHCITEMKREGVREYDFNGLLNDGISTFKRNFASLRMNWWAAGTIRYHHLLL